MKGGSSETIVVLFLCIFCFILSSIAGGVGYYFMDLKECESDTDCNASGLGKCNASGVCVASASGAGDGGGDGGGGGGGGDGGDGSAADPHVDGPQSPCNIDAPNCGTNGEGNCYPEKNANDVVVAVCKCSPGYKYDPDAEGPQCVEDMNWDIMPSDTKKFYGKYDNQSTIGYGCKYGDIDTSNYFKDSGVCEDGEWADRQYPYGEIDCTNATQYLSADDVSELNQNPNIKNILNHNLYVVT